MSKLERLIAKLCPDGVEFKTIGEVCELSAGGDVPKDHYSKELTKDYTVPIYSNGVGVNALYGYTDIPKINEPCVTIAARGTIGYCELRREPFYPVVRLICAIPRESIHVDYLKYVLETITFQVPTSGIPQLTVPMVSKYRIPLPPLPVQQEIVRILDNFTELTSELTGELTAELAARRKQYDYYRDLLFRFDNLLEVKWMTIGEICTNVYSGGTPATSRKEYYNGSIPWLRTQEVDFVDIYDTGVKITEEGFNNSSAKWIPENCVIVALYGATAAKVAINKIPLTTNQACCNLQIDNSKALYRYIFYWLSSQYVKLKALGQGSQSNINIKTVKNYPVPVPPLEEQEHIVSILDRFDALCNDLTSSLSAEIEARQKQYEYYRDKLLSFKEVSA